MIRLSAKNGLSLMGTAAVIDFFILLLNFTEFTRLFKTELPEPLSGQLMHFG